MRKKLNQLLLAKHILPLAFLIGFFLFVLSILTVQRFTFQLDLTEGKIHQLSDESIKILTNLPRKVTINYYVNRSENILPYELRNYSERVEKFLEKVSGIAGEQLNVRLFDPVPDSEAEDSAIVDEILPMRETENDSFYFGLSVNSAGQKTAIPFLDPNKENDLEIDLMKAIHSVSLIQRKKIAIVADQLPIEGVPQEFGPWYFLSELSKNYHISVYTDSQNLDDTYDLIVLIHPGKITKALRNQIDSHLGAGRNIVVMLDPGAHSFDMYGITKTPDNNHSNWRDILDALGIHYLADYVVMDFKLRTEINRGNGVETLEFALNVNSKNVAQNHPITKGITKLHFPLAGGFQYNNKRNLRFTPLVFTSDVAYLVDTVKISGIPGQAKENEQTKGPFAIAALIEGVIPSLGNLQELENRKSSKVALIADTDFIADPFIGEITHNQGRAQLYPSSNNLSLFMSTVEFLTDTTALRQSRMRSVRSRPLTKIIEAETKVYDRYRDRIDELVQKIEDIEKSITPKAQGEVVSQMTEKQALKYRSKIDNLKSQHIKLRKELRSARQNLKLEVNRVQSRVKWINVAVMPIVLLLTGTTVLLRRNYKAR